jgi:predicted AAA+ superfamily ATPase
MVKRDGCFSHNLEKIDAMKRNIDIELSKWCNSASRIPLLLRGARQIGKTYTVRKLAETHFKNIVEINFELEPFYVDCFQSLNPQHIINRIVDISRQKIIEGETLFFLDEIQICPQAIMALRYFKEMMPALHVIGAGSLLEFTINDDRFSMPVGRVQYMYMKPLSFREYMDALGYEGLLKQLHQVSIDQSLEKVFHQKFLQLIREYLLIGGMPEAVLAYINTQEYQEAQYQQTILLNTYRNDFGKYAKQSNHKYLQKVFDQTPALLGQQIKYNKIDAEVRSRELKEAIFCLNNAGIIRTVYSSSAAGLPLQALINEKKFKLLFLDVGLVARATQVAVSQLLSDDIDLINQGAISEQFVGQELLAYQDCRLDPQLHYWSRDEIGSQAEVDYLITKENQIIPVEVKSGTTGKLKSMHMLMRERKLPLGIRISESPLELQHNILSVPFYLISELPRLIELYG